MSYDYIFEYVVVGDSGAGKTNLVLGFTENQFNNMQPCTIGVNYSVRDVSIGNKLIRLQIWDTAGQERFRSRPIIYYCKNVQAAMIVYDVTRRESFSHLESRLKLVREHAPQEIVIMLIGNRIDLPAKRQVTTEEGQDFARRHGLDFMETSAKTSENVEEAFISTTKIVCGKIQAGTFKIKNKRPVPTMNRKQTTLDPDAIDLRPLSPQSGDATTSPAHIFKYIIVGAQSVGKTALMLQFTEKIFRLEHHQSTIGVGIGSRTLTIDGEYIKLQIYDTIGQERFNSITRSYYRNAAVALIVYDVTDRQTFKRLPRWLKEVRNNTSQYIAIMLVGNKIDLIEERQVRKSEGEAFARDNGLEFMEVSAKTAAKVKRVFEHTAEEVYEKIQAELFDVNTEPSGIKLGSNGSDSKNTSGTSKCGGC